MIILAIDPGTSKRNPAGLVVIDTDAMALLYGETIGLTSWEATAQAVFNEAVRLRDYHFEAVAWEGSYFDRKKNNPHTHEVLASFAGIGLAIAALFDLPWAAVLPNEAKLALTRSYKADKEAMVKMARLVFRLDKPPSSHVADACGVALAGATALQLEKVLEARLIV